MGVYPPAEFGALSSNAHATCPHKQAHKLFDGHQRLCFVAHLARCFGHMCRLCSATDLHKYEHMEPLQVSPRHVAVQPPVSHADL